MTWAEKLDGELGTVVIIALCIIASILIYYFGHICGRIAAKRERVKASQSQFDREFAATQESINAGARKTKSRFML
jgi:hypothetical protein